MVKKFHVRVALFCTLVTSIILLTMSTILLVFWERTLWENEQSSFLNDAHMMITTMENQPVLSNEWIARMERGGQFILSIADTGNPILYETLVHTREREETVERAREAAYERYGFPPGYPIRLTRTNTFALNLGENRQYYVSAVLIPREIGFLEVYIIYSLEPLIRQIFHQRVMFLMLNVVGIALLGLFSYFFTKKMMEPLRKSRQQQTEFIASASHELRTPLAVVQSSLSALRKADEREAPRFYNSIASECERMSHLIRDLLALASADNYSFSMEMKEVEIDTLLLEVYEKFELLAKEKGIRLSLTLPSEKVPRIKGDGLRLTQVMAILLDNAFDYAPQGSEVSLVLRRSKGRLYIQVIDQGPGIPDEQKERIWERFYQADTSRSSEKNFGLGLPIAKEIVTVHRGKIEVSDHPQGGTIFTVTLM